MYLNFFKRGTGLGLFLVFLLSACDASRSHQSPYPLEYSDGIMGTRFTIKISHLPEDADVILLRQQIRQLLDRLDGDMSTYRPDSELSRLNQSQNSDWQTISGALFRVLEKAKEVYQFSHKAFDVTVGPLVNLWGFGPEPMNFKEPAPEQIVEALKKTGSHLFLLDASRVAVKKQNPGLYIDLSALAKGYAVDRVALLLEDHGIHHYMVEIGGELRLKGHNLQGHPWRIAIEKPNAESRMIQKVISVTNISMATSGDYRNFFEVDDVRYSHSIDPRNGYPVKHKLASVTVLSDTCMDADAWATALTVLGPQQGLELAEQKGLAALFIIKTAGGYMEKGTSAFRQYFKVES